jgi:hypothetical protein
MATTQRSHELLVARKARPFEAAIQRWMLRRAREEADRQIKSLVQRKGKWAIAKSLWLPVSKASPIDKELRDIILRFGVARATDASLSATNIRGLQRIIDPQRLRNELGSKEFRLKVFTVLDKWGTKRVRDISEETKKMVKHSIMRMLKDAAREVPQPSPGEMARRIRRSFHGIDPQQRIYAWSPERAELIARTELNMAENTGAFRGYSLVNDLSEKTNWKPMKRWLASRDGKSVDRHHERMNGVTIEMDKHFVTPLGNKMMHPGDMDAPIKETANCRCGMLVVMVKRG